MQRKLRIRLFVIVILILVAGSTAYYALGASAGDGTFTLSGTIEATEVHLASQFGGQVKQVYVSEGDRVEAGENLVHIYSTTGNLNETITSPITGVVLERLVEPGELAAAGSTVMVVASLDDLTLTVYVPENRCGQISLGQTYPVTVDSFPGEMFSGTVRFISDQAEFTPRNVQTTDRRQTTVYAVKLGLNPTGGRLKPGMPADVHFAAP